VSELDGNHHKENKGYDKTRTDFLEHIGFTVIRLWNQEVRADITKALKNITTLLNPTPNPSP
jgi:very-short-patch-repair endonuclease